jgi:hypothetical protein
MKSTLRLCLGLFLSPVFSASAQSVTAFWTTINPGAMTAEGMLGPVTIAATQLGSPGTFFGDLSGPDYSGAPLSATQRCLELSGGSDFRFTLSRPVTGLMLYVVFWRSDSYAFDQPFTILSGLASGVSVAGNTLTTTNGFSHGIIRFDAPISILNCVSASAVAGAQSTTLGVIPKTTVAVDGGRLLRTRRPSIKLKGDTSASFSVDRVLIKEQGKQSKFAKLSSDRTRWSARLRPETGRARVKVTAFGLFSSGPPAVTKVTLIRE